MSVDAVQSSREVPAAEKNSNLSTSKLDKTADQQILDCLSSSEPLTNRVIQYSYDLHPYSLRIIYNPQKKTLAAGKEQFFFQTGLISAEPLPAKLKEHLKSLFQEKGYNLEFNSNGSENPDRKDFDRFSSVTIVSEQPPAETQAQTAEQLKAETAPPQQSEITSSKPVAKTSKYDAAADDKIKAVLNTKTLTKQTVDYHFNDKIFQVFILNNPQYLPLWSEGTENLLLTRVYLHLPDHLPMPLEIHLTKMIYKQEITQDLKKVPIARNPKNITSKHAARLEPVTVSPRDKLDNFDEEIRKCLSSKELVSRVFIYQIQDQIVKARIIHNPTGEYFRRTLPIDSDKKTFSCSYKYMIFLDKKSPELMDHLQTVLNLSLWDRVWNFWGSNGDKTGWKVNGEWDLTYFDIYGPQDSITSS